MPPIKTALADLYLDRVNNFLTLDVFSEYYQLTLDQAKILLELGETFHEERVERHKQNLAEYGKRLASNL